MKTIEFIPDGVSHPDSAAASPRDRAARNEVLIDVLPQIFHKLKNKLTPILGYTQILLARAGDDFTRERLQRIERNTAELGENLNTLKEYGSRPAAPLRPAALDRLLEEMAPEWQGVADAAAARVVLELEPGLPELPLEPARLRVLLLDLAANAAQALRDTPAGRREIRLRLSAEKQALKLSFRDNGRGMAADELAALWTPFRSGFPGGAGLGLVLCERIIADHGARCEVAADPGEYCEFIIRFPLAGEALPSPQSQRRTHEE
ncbi:MAG TPA: sensor histidine kinase [Candidatus Aminicenantes bacterium]|nr:sensor histidine kinase [Candidatus Aminicenantes bacterium]